MPEYQFIQSLVPERGSRH